MRNLAIHELRDLYRNGDVSPRQVLDQVLSAIQADRMDNAWIRVLSRAELEPYLANLEKNDPEAFPLYGIPFAIKDNIDLAGIATTAGCPAYSYVPEQSAFAVQRLVAAGAIPVGKTNLDQFATGLVGTRSPYGPCRNTFDSSFIAGGSSSGSASAVARNRVSFSLGTDTAGSGRVPAAFNNLVAAKPSRGLVSNTGVVPACRTLDCMAVFAGQACDAQDVLNVIQAYDPEDPYARAPEAPPHGHGRIPEEGFRFGVPPREQMTFFGDTAYEACFDRAVASLKAIGGEPVTIDFAPFRQAGELLYEGPWVAERYAAIRDFMDAQPEAMLPVTRSIIGTGKHHTAVDGFEAAYRLQALARRTEPVWEGVDLVVTPTAGTLPTAAAVEREPVAQNSRLGYYTNFMNLLDLCAVTVPTDFTPAGLPFGCTIFAPAFYDGDLLALADRLHRARSLPTATATGRSSDQPTARSSSSHTLPVAVCGAHMSGLALNHQLTQRHARLRLCTHSAPQYRLYALPGGPPERPGLVRDPNDGRRIGLEVWDVPLQQVGSLLAEIPPPLGLGRVELDDGSTVAGFLCEAYATREARDVTEFGNWRQYLAG